MCFIFCCYTSKVLNFQYFYWNFRTFIFIEPAKITCELNSIFFCNYFIFSLLCAILNKLIINITIIPIIAYTKLLSSVSILLFSITWFSLLLFCTSLVSPLQIPSLLFFTISSLSCTFVHIYNYSVTYKLLPILFAPINSVITHHLPISKLNIFYNV